MDEPLIRYKNVNINQQELGVLEDVNLELNKGEFVYLIGKVGSGKTSLLKTIYGELDIQSGDAEVLGYNMSNIKRKHIPQLRRRLGIVFQDFQLLTDRNVHSNLSFVLRATGWSNKIAIKERIDEVLDQVGMTGKGYKMPNELSGGEQQRIVIARAILNRPEIILADEPTGNLDSETGRQIVELLKSICASGSAIILTATPTPDIPGFINNTGSVDLLYAVNMKQTAGETGQVKVNFRHALSQVRFLLSRKSDPSVNPIRVEINKVELVNIASKGDFQMPRATTSAVTTDRGEWTNLGNIQNVTLYDGKSKTLTDTPTEYNTPGYIFSIPQELLASVRQGNSFNGAWLSVRCSIYDDVSGVRLWPSTTDLGYENGFALLYFPLNADDSRYPEWEPGKAYSYGISIGVPQGSSAIDFDVTVDEYGDFLQ